MIKFDILTLFPEMFQSPFNSSLQKKAIEKGILKVTPHNIRLYAEGKHRVTDDVPYGGGGGMVMKVEPIARALEAIVPNRSDALVVLLSPQGKLFKQTMAEELARYKHIVLICGHYEGIDERIRTHLVDREISIGDYVLSGGELPAMVVIEAVSRLLPGFTGNQESILNDSFTSGLLEGPHYTRPRTYKTWSVPDVLVSGHQKNIEMWKHRESLKRTLERRPDLLKRADLTDGDRDIIEEIRNDATPQSLFGKMTGNASHED